MKSSTRSLWHCCRSYGTRLSLFFLLNMALWSGEAVSQESRGFIRRQLLPSEGARAEGHPKLVALLVAEDYSRLPGRSAWGDLAELPGVWQDLARVQRRLQALGFGKIIVLAGGEQKGNRRTVSLRSLSGLSEWESEAAVEIGCDGPATREAILQAARELKSHLNTSRTVGDDQGGEVPPVFVFYYSGHGFVDSRGLHQLPLSDNVAGEPTGDLLELVLNTVGADDESRGSAGGGTSLVFLDCCQAGLGVTQGAKSGGQQGGLLEASIMDAIRAGRRGRFFVGASLGDETAKESAGGGYFTGALCAALHPDYLGQDQSEVRTLSLNHLVLSVDQILLQQGGQAVSRFPTAADPQWENWVLFPNPHYQGQRERLRLIVRTLPVDVPVQVLGWEGGAYKDLGLLADPFLKDALGGRAEHRVFQVPESWRGRSLRLQAVPVRTSDRVQYEPSSAMAVVLQADAQGTPPIAALALQKVGVASGVQREDAAFQRAQETFQQAQQQQNPQRRFRQLRTAQALLRDSQRAFAGAARTEIERQLEQVRPEAGQARLGELVQIARVPAKKQRYRQAYDELAALEEDPVELREFGLAAGEVERQVAIARQVLLQDWKSWAEQQRRMEAERRLSKGEAFLASSQPWHSWRQSFEAEVLVGSGERSRGLAEQSVQSAVNQFFQQQVSLEVLVSNSAYGILLDLMQGTGVFVEQLRQDLQRRFAMDPADLGRRLEEDQVVFRKTYAAWFPPDVVPGWSGEADGEMTVSLSDGAAMEFVWIEPGTFLMGSPSSESGRYDNEGPQHRVTISKGFWLGKYETTQAQWKSVMGNNPSKYRGENHPVEQISWDDVQQFIRKLNQAEGESRYRLPTEAEWEYACRSGTTSRWSFGDDESQLSDYAWYGGNNSPSGTKEVGRKLPNPWGLYDMHGNVYEWCQDWFGNYSSKNQTDPTGPASGSDRVGRGGNFGNLARNVRSADRDYFSPDYRYSYIGARLLRTK